MSFTDDDLQRLKDLLGNNEERVYVTKDLWALIARLEAAERIVAWDGHISYQRLTKAWRKAAGK